MRPKKVTFRHLERMLVQAGFETVGTSGQHKAFRHLASDTVIVLPAYRPTSVVDELHIAAVRKSLYERGLADEHTLEATLGAVAERA